MNIPAFRSCLRFGMARGLLALSLVLSAIGIAHCDTPIPMRNGAVTDAEWAVIRAGLLDGDHALLDTDYVLLYGRKHGETTPDRALVAMRAKDIYVGYFDFDADGTDEFIFNLDWGCGSLGCPTEIFKQVGQRWQMVFSYLTFGASYLCATDEFGLKGPVVYSIHTYFWWDGENYQAGCKNKGDCPDADADGLERLIGLELQQRRDCEATPMS